MAREENFRNCDMDEVCVSLRVCVCIFDCLRLSVRMIFEGENLVREEGLKFCDM